MIEMTFVCQNVLDRLRHEMICWLCQHGTGTDHKTKKTEETQEMTETYLRETKCPVCKQTVPQTGKGRPRVTHDEDGCQCRKFEQLRSWMENLLVDQLPQTKECRESVRGELMRLINQTNTWGK